MLARNGSTAGSASRALRCATKRLLNDTSVPLRHPRTRYSLLLWVTFPKLSQLRASDVLESQIMIAGSPYDLEPTIAELARRLATTYFPRLERVGQLLGSLVVRAAGRHRAAGSDLALTGV